MLTRVPELRVPARTSSLYFEGKQTTIADIAKELGVAHVFEGSVRKNGRTIRITAQLIRADTSYHVWSQTYDRVLDDIFRIQDEIAGAVVFSSSNLAFTKVGSRRAGVIERRFLQLTDASAIFPSSRDSGGSTEGIRVLPAGR